MADVSDRYIEPVSPDLSPDETVPPDEAAALAAIVQNIEASVRKAAAESGMARRDAHPKAHGCVKAEFRILDDLPETLRAGLFARPGVHQAWIRFSNSNPTPQGDKPEDGRGMAIKVLDVPDSPSGTQDFLMVNAPVFIVRNAADYLAFLQASPQWRFFVPDLNPFHLRVREFFIVRSLLGRRVQDPLDSRYWSMSPYQYGDRVCKFSAVPTSGPSPFNQTDSENFLRDNLISHLKEREATFDFRIQLRTNPATMPVEDACIEWREEEAPFVTVARVTIPPQDFDSPEQRAFCENLSFTAWHGLAAHRPLGGLNRLRRTVYDAVSRLRHEINGTPRVEPDPS